MKIYLAGPMRGYKRFNFDAFFEAEKKLRDEGHTVISPARHDIEMGFDPDKTLEEQPNFSVQEAFSWDVLQVVGRCDCIFVLDGWELSEGARAEVIIAKMIGRPVYRFSDRVLVTGFPQTGMSLQALFESLNSPRVVFPDGVRKPVHAKPGGQSVTRPKETILEEANRIVDGPRRDSYGHPMNNHGRTAEMWSAYLGTPVTPRQVCMCMVLQKVSRDSNESARDNLVDIAGYARNAELCAEAANAQSPS